MCSIEHKVNGSYSGMTPRARERSDYESFSSSYSSRGEYSSENY